MLPRPTSVAGRDPKAGLGTLAPTNMALSRLTGPGTTRKSNGLFAGPVNLQRWRRAAEHFTSRTATSKNGSGSHIAHAQAGYKVGHMLILYLFWTADQ